MDIDTGDSLPISQKPYNLSLKHTTWVQKELETLEKAGIIICSVSPWTNPIVVVPKRNQLGEPPWRRLCVDYWAVHNLLPPVTKAHSMAKGVLTLVPLPEIDEMYVSWLVQAFILPYIWEVVTTTWPCLWTLRENQLFLLTPMAKFEFQKDPSGLAQVHTYFQQWINEVLRSLDFASGYLDDILIYSPYP